MSPTSARRRQRSTRLVVAVSLVVIAALSVLGAILSGSLPAVSIAAAVAVVLGAAAVRIVHSELMSARVEANRDRAELAQEYTTLEARTRDEHDAQQEFLSAGIEHRQQVIAQLQSELAAATRQVAKEHLRGTREAKRAELAGRRVARLETSLADAEERSALATVALAELEQQVADLKAELAAWETSMSHPSLKKHA